MGLQTTRPGRIVKKDDVSIAKNYLTETELQPLNRIVNAYLEFAELRWLRRRPSLSTSGITRCSIRSQGWVDADFERVGKEWKRMPAVGAKKLAND